MYEMIMGFTRLSLCMILCHINGQVFTLECTKIFQASLDVVKCFNAYVFTTHMVLALIQ